jgi:hypothetical protein
MDFVRSTTPLVARIFKPANQFLLLGIYANHWSASAQKCLPLSGNVLKLLVAPGRLLPGQPLMIHSK